MTNEEFKSVLAKNGVSAEDIEKTTAKFDIEKVEGIFDAASTPREAFENCKKFYPQLDVEEAIKQMDFVMSQFEAATKGEMTEGAVELSEEELDMISAAGLFGLNWKKIGAGIVGGLLGAVPGLVVGALAGGVTGFFMGGPAGGSAGLIAGASLGAAAGFFIGYKAGVNVYEGKDRFDWSSLQA